MRILIVINSTSQIDNTLAFCTQIVVRAGEAPTVLTVIERRSEHLLRRADELQSYAWKILEIPDLITRVRIGNPAKEITLEAKERNYDLVVMREERTSYLVRPLHESIALRVAERVPCPTIVVKGNARPIRRILLCDSGAGGLPVLSRFTAQLADLLEGEEDVTILHVMSQMSAGPGVLGNHLQASVEELIAEHTPEGQLLGRDVQVLEQPGIHPIPKVRHGLVVDEILAEARIGDYDLLVIGAHDGERWQRYLLEDLARKILIRSDRPVLMVK